MKLNPMLTSTLPPTSNGERYLHFPTGLILKRPNPPTSDIPREDRMTAVMYVQPDGTALYATSPKPPTPEAVARAQFVDKTYVWKGAAPKAQLP
jgi:hypothetical protein